MKKYLLIVFLFSSFLAVAQNKTEAYIEKYSQIAVDEMNMYNIPASITLAQGILESGNGESRLAVDGKNHFGIKCHSNWNGKTIIEDDDEKGECFRKYNFPETSYKDHSLFLSERKRYAFLFDYDLKDYKKWAYGLRKAGYATDKKYPIKLLNLIKTYRLYEFDAIKENGNRKKTKQNKRRKKIKQAKRIYKIPKTHKVKKGDTLYAISRKYGLTIFFLQQLNNLSGTTLIVGQQLLLQ